MTQDITIQIKGPWRIPNATDLHTNIKNFGHNFAFDAPTVRNDLLDDVHSATTLAWRLCGIDLAMCME